MAVLPDTDIPLQAGRSTTQLDFPELMRLRLQQGLAARQNQMLALEQEKQQRAMADEDQLRSIVAEGGNPQDIYNRLLGAGRLPEALGLQEQQTKHGTAVMEQQAKLGGLIKQAAGNVLANPTEQTAIAALNELQQLTGHSMDKDKALVYGFRGDPTAIKRWAAGYVDPEKLFPKTERVDLGGHFETQQLDPLTGQVTTLGAQAKTLSPADITRNALTREGHQIQLRGQNLTDARARERLITDNKPPPGYRFKKDGSGDYEPVPGGPADQKINTAKSGRETVEELTTTLRDYYNQLDESGGITNVEGNKVSNIGAAAATTGFGQMVGRSLGTHNQSIRDSIAQTRPLLLQAIKNATGMSAKQMDSNAELRIWLSAATDPSQGYQANIRALDKLNDLYGLGLDKQEPAKDAPQAKSTNGSVLDSFRREFGY